MEDVRCTSTVICRIQSLNFEQSILQISSVVYGAAASWCDELIDSVGTWSIIPEHGQIRREGERSVMSKVGTSRSGYVQPPTKNVQAAGDPLRMHQERFEALSPGKNSPSLAESIYCLVIIKIPHLLHGSAPGLVQFVKSKAYVVLIKMELRYRYRQHQETDRTPRWLYPEGQTVTWRNRGMTKMTLPKTVRW